MSKSVPIIIINKHTWCLSLSTNSDGQQTNDCGDHLDDDEDIHEEAVYNQGDLKKHIRSIHWKYVNRINPKSENSASFMFTQIYAMFKRNCQIMDVSILFISTNTSTQMLFPLSGIELTAHFFNPTALTNKAIWSRTMHGNVLLYDWKVQNVMWKVEIPKFSVVSQCLKVEKHWKCWPLQ